MVKYRGDTEAQWLVLPPRSKYAVYNVCRTNVLKICIFMLDTYARCRWSTERFVLFILIDQADIMMSLSADAVQTGD